MVPEIRIPNLAILDHESVAFDKLDKRISVFDFARFQEKFVMLLKKFA